MIPQVRGITLPQRRAVRGVTLCDQLPRLFIVARKLRDAARVSATPPGKRQGLVKPPIREIEQELRAPRRIVRQPETKRFTAAFHPIQQVTREAPLRGRHAATHYREYEREGDSKTWKHSRRAQAPR
jgi:hypothetical protein